MNTSAGELTMLHQDIIRTMKELADEDKRHKEARETIRVRLQSLRARADQHGAGLDPDAIARAKTVLDIGGSYARGGGDRASVVRDAIRALVTDGGELLYSEYFGTKQYDRWVGQREDHGYNFGPKHGSIIFSVGLRQSVRRPKRELTPQEIEDAVYYLTNIERIETASSEVKA